MPNKRRQSVKYYLSKIIFSLAFVFGILALFSLASSPENLRDEVAATVAELRGPASVGAVESKPKYKMGQLLLKCGIQKYDFSGIHQIRIKGAPCAHDPQGTVTQSKIKNESLGVDATVFLGTSNSFTTDYVTLTRGENLFTLQSTFADGSVLEKNFSIIAN